MTAVSTARAEYKRQWQIRNKDKARAATKRFQEKNRTKLAAKTAQWRKDNSAKYKDAKSHWHRKTLYKMERHTYEQLLISQHGLCAICFRLQPNGKALCVDHCHATGKVRGLLCHNCNRSLGLMNDDAAVLYRAAQYLEAAQLRS